MTLVLSSQIFGAAFVEPGAAALLSDEACFRTLLEVEVALAQAQAELGAVPASAAAAIERAAAALPFDPGRLAAGVRRDGVPIVALVAQLRDALGPDAAEHVHRGATSQDIVDSATVLSARRVLARVDASSAAVIARLAALARHHRRTLMAARTHAQQALPTTFGLKLASWALPLARHRERLAQLLPRLCVVQLGGAAGTQLALGPHALELEAALARRLGLGVAELPWHSQRDSIAELGAWLALFTGSLGKLAQDIILMCQSEVAELSEAQPGERGQSSSMPHKNNPMRSEQILAAARAVAAHSAALAGALVQEHERGTHGWQVEWLCLSPALLLAAGAARNAEELLAELVVFPERMRDNLAGQHDLVLAEAAVMALSAQLPRPQASALVAAAARRALAEGRSLLDVLPEEHAARRPQEGSPASVDWGALARRESHLGQADALLARALDRLDRCVRERPAPRG